MSTHTHTATNPGAFRKIIYTHIINYITDTSSRRRSILKVNFQFIYYAVHTQLHRYTQRERKTKGRNLQIHLQLQSLSYIYNKYRSFQFYIQYVRRRFQLITRTTFIAGQGNVTILVDLKREPFFN